MHTDKGPGTGGQGLGTIPLFFGFGRYFSRVVVRFWAFWARFAVWTGLAGEIEVFKDPVGGYSYPE
jgi:hypothetical protein